MEQRTKIMLYRNKNVGVVLTALFLAALAYYANQEWVFERLRDKFILGLLTLTAVIWMLACSMLMIFDGQRNEEMGGLENIFSPMFFVAIGVPIICYLFFLGALWIGFPVAMIIFCSGTVYVLGLRPAWSALVSGIVMAGFIYSLFWVIGARLPLGLIGKALGLD